MRYLVRERNWPARECGPLVFADGGHLVTDLAADLVSGAERFGVPADARTAAVRPSGLFVASTSG